MAGVCQDLPGLGAGEVRGSSQSRSWLPCRIKPLICHLAMQLLTMTMFISILNIYAFNKNSLLEFYMQYHFFHLGIGCVILWQVKGPYVNALTRAEQSRTSAPGQRGVPFCNFVMNLMT